MRKIVFLTGTRADYGKMKPIMMKVDAAWEYEAHIFVTGMHMLDTYGYTCLEVERDGYANIYKAVNQGEVNEMDETLARTLFLFGPYIKNLKPDLIVVHGDRLEALAGAIAGAFNNVRVAHIEGGEVSGTIDESIRHAITKMSHYHFVSNDEAAQRIVQMGEDRSSIFTIGSPDIDIMVSGELPSLDSIRRKYEIDFDEYGILMYHPVTTELDLLTDHIKNVVDGVIESGRNYIVIYPNNDHGNRIILEEYRRFEKMPTIRMFPSIRFEYFLGLIRNADFMIGNSSAGIREAGVYGVPAIDIGTRQEGRYGAASNIIHVVEDRSQILIAINSCDGLSRHRQDLTFGAGRSADRFLEILGRTTFWNQGIQKKFRDYLND